MRNASVEFSTMASYQSIENGKLNIPIGGDEISSSPSLPSSSSLSSSSSTKPLVTKLARKVPFKKVFSSSQLPVGYQHFKNGPTSSSQSSPSTIINIQTPTKSYTSVSKQNQSNRSSITSTQSFQLLNDEIHRKLSSSLPGMFNDLQKHDAQIDDLNYQQRSPSSSKYSNQICFDSSSIDRFDHRQQQQQQPQQQQQQQKNLKQSHPSSRLKSSKQSSMQDIQIHQYHHQYHRDHHQTQSTSKTTTTTTTMTTATTKQNDSKNNNNDHNNHNNGNINRQQSKQQHQKKSVIEKRTIDFKKNSQSDSIKGRTIEERISSRSDETEMMRQRLRNIPLNSMEPSVISALSAYLDELRYFNAEKFIKEIDLMLIYFEDAIRKDKIELLNGSCNILIETIAINCVRLRDAYRHLQQIQISLHLLSNINQTDDEDENDDDDEDCDGDEDRNVLDDDDQGDGRKNSNDSNNRKKSSDSLETKRFE